MRPVGLYVLPLVTAAAFAAAQPDFITIRLQVESSRNVGAELLIAKVLRNGGFNVVRTGQRDASLSVEIIATPLSERYTTGTFETGADVKGTFLLEVPDQPARQRSFSNRLEPFWGIIQLPLEYSPPLRAFQTSSWLQELSQLIRDAFGEQAWVRFCVGTWKDAEIEFAGRKYGRLALDPRAVEPLLSELSLGRISLKSAVEALQTSVRDGKVLWPALRDPNGSVRAAAADTLAAIGDKSASEVLASVLSEEKDAGNRAIFVASLARLDSANVAPFLKAAKDPDANVRVLALEALGRSKDGSQIAPLIVGLKDPDAKVRRTAARFLGVTDSSSGADIHILESLMAALRSDKDPEVRINSMRSIAALDKMQVPSLLAALKDQDATVRGAAITLFGEMGDRRSIGPLIAAMEDQPISVRRPIAAALKKITSQDFGMDYQAWSKWWAAQEKPNQ
jgi:HEAT repeat protein